jgi:hypothetical protein
MSESQLISVQGEDDYRPWPELRHTAFVLRKIAREMEQGSVHTIRAALVFTAFSIEGFLQTLGPEAFGVGWPKIERKGFKEKVAALASHYGIVAAWDSTPWREMESLIVARNSLAHAKPEERTFEVEMSESDFNAADGTMHSRIRAYHSPLENLARLDEMAALVDKALLSIWVAAGKNEHAFTMHGTSIYSATAIRPGGARP